MIHTVLNPPPPSPRPPQDDYVYYDKAGSAGKTSLTREERTAARLKRPRMVAAAAVGSSSSSGSRRPTTAAARRGREKQQQLSADVTPVVSVTGGGGGSGALAKDWATVASIAERELVFGAGAAATSSADWTMEHARVMWARAQLNRLNNGDGTESPLTSLPERSPSSSGSPKGGFGMGQDEARGTLVGLATCRRPPSATGAAVALAPAGDTSINDVSAPAIYGGRAGIGDDTRAVLPAAVSPTANGRSDQDYYNHVSPRDRSNSNRQPSPRVGMKRKPGSPCPASRGRMMTPHAAMAHHIGERNVPLPEEFGGRDGAGGGSHLPRHSPTAKGSPHNRTTSYDSNHSAVDGCVGTVSDPAQPSVLPFWQPARLSTPPPTSALRAEGGEEGPRSCTVGKVENGSPSSVGKNGMASAAAVVFVSPSNDSNAPHDKLSKASNYHNLPNGYSGTVDLQEHVRAALAVDPERVAAAAATAGANGDFPEQAAADALPGDSRGPAGGASGGCARNCTDDEAAQSVFGDGSVELSTPLTVVTNDSELDLTTSLASPPSNPANRRPRLPWNPSPRAAVVAAAAAAAEAAEAAAADGASNAVLSSDRDGVTNGGGQGQQGAPGSAATGSGSSLSLRKSTRMSRG